MVHILCIIIYGYVSVDCGVLDDPTNGMVSNSTIFDSTATYTCDTGYSLTGNDTTTCLISGNWSSEPIICTSKNSITDVAVNLITKNVHCLMQLLTVILWLTLEMGWCHSLLQHTIQWPLTPAILATIRQEMTREHARAQASGLAVNRHAPVRTMMYI